MAAMEVDDPDTAGPVPNPSIAVSPISSASPANNIYYKEENDRENAFQADSCAAGVRSEAAAAVKAAQAAAKRKANARNYARKLVTGTLPPIPLSREAANAWRAQQRLAEARTDGDYSEIDPEQRKHLLNTDFTFHGFRRGGARKSRKVHSKVHRKVHRKSSKKQRK